VVDVVVAADGTGAVVDSGAGSGVGDDDGAVVDVDVVGVGTGTGAGIDAAGSGRTSTYRASVSTNATVRTAVDRRTGRRRITILRLGAARSRARS
jgi:hypothetical protein